MYCIHLCLLFTSENQIDLGWLGLWKKCCGKFKVWHLGAGSKKEEELDFRSTMLTQQEYSGQMMMTSCRDPIFTENIWFVWSWTSYSGLKWRFHHTRQPNERTREDRALSQYGLLEGWVSKRENYFHLCNNFCRFPMCRWGNVCGDKFVTILQDHLLWRDIKLYFFIFVTILLANKKRRNKITSCGGTSNETVLRSTHLYASMHGITKKIPGPCGS